MSEQKKCILCREEECLSTLGQFCLCTDCRKQVLQDALVFAKRNTTRGTLYHAAFEALSAEYEKEA
ncbi:MAG: hypothetical protein IJN25_08300 [Clostridia bacterium]|nr:hypothetical protein [Oscillospiraceae bacterium]MBQ7033640.1 hypothetical protein [Clostridia bacterium]